MKERYLIILSVEKKFINHSKQSFLMTETNHDIKENHLLCCVLSDNLFHIEQYLYDVCSNTFVESVFMMDTKKDILYIYKTKGSLDEIKKEVLPKLEIPFKFITKNDMVFDKVEDLRILNKIKTTKTTLN